ncbi:MAG: DUF3841 domain-containing protein [Microbacterium sp.]
MTRCRTSDGALRAYDELPKRSWWLAPPAHVVSSPGADMLTMYTIQTRDAYETLACDGVLVGDSTRGWPEYQEAYGWMLREMDRRLPSTDGGLLWLWPKATRRVLSDNAKHARGEVLLTVRMPREQVLLSEFVDWHCVLNRFLHIPQHPGESDQAWERRGDAVHDGFDARARPFSEAPIEQWPNGLRAEIEGSWQAIFDPTTWGADAALQATARRVLASDVLRAVRIR